MKTPKKANRLLARLRQPKWRHGRRSALLMAAFLALFVLANAAVTGLENLYGWRKDLSYNSYATTGEETQKALERVQDDVELYLLYQNGDEDEQVLQVLNRYKVLSEHISVIPTDIARNPAILSRFSGDETTSVSADSVIVSCPATGRYKVLNYQNFFTTGYNIEAGEFQIEGLSYEKNLTEAIVYVTREEIPTVGFLQGHGELTLENLTNFTDFLTSNNIDSRSVNLRTGDVLDGIDCLFIVGLQKDLTDDEAQTLLTYTQSGGNVFIVRDYTDPIEGVPNYLAFLRSYGVTPLAGVAVAGEEDTDTYYGEPLYIIPKVCELDMTAALLSSGYDVLLMPAASAFEDPGEPDSSLTVATVLKTGPHGYLRSLTDGRNTLEKQEGDREGELSLALYAHRVHANGNVSRLFALGNSAMLADEYIYQSTFNDQFLTAVLKELVPTGEISLDIMAASAFRPSLTVGSQTMGVALLVALPLLILLAAAFFLLPRRQG